MRARLQFMQSSGGLTDAHLFQGKDAILSGPAGGVVGAVEVSRLAGFDRIIGFDMGGTSTDVTHYAGEYERAFVTEVAGVRLRAPMMRIHTVAAGGGSICTFDGARFRVGPESAGANPGPASYRRGGPLTVTDCNVMVGKLDPELFPQRVRPARRRAARRRRRAREVRGARRRGRGARPAAPRTPEEVADGFLKIAVDEHGERDQAHLGAARLRRHRVHAVLLRRRGGQHACLVADALGMTRVCSIRSPACCRPTAWGSPTCARCASRRSRRALSRGGARRGRRDVRGARGGGARRGRGAGHRRATRIACQRTLHLKYEGTDTTLETASTARARRSSPNSSAATGSSTAS